MDATLAICEVAIVFVCVYYLVGSVWCVESSLVPILKRQQQQKTSSELFSAIHRSAVWDQSFTLHVVSFLGVGCRGCEITASSKYSKKVTAEKSHEQSGGCIKTNDVGKTRLCRSVRVTGAAETNARDGQKKLRAQREKEMHGKSQKLPVPESVSSFHHFMFTQFLCRHCAAAVVTVHISHSCWK